ncbi:MAG: hypothetical protein ABEI99_12630, partial [Halobaculum sp.]
LFVRVESSLTLRIRGDDSLVVEFPAPTALSVAFEETIEPPGQTVTVPRTPEGVATALSVIPAANETVRPDRTWPSMRNRPPEIEFGEEVRIPSEVADETVQTDVELVVPPRLSYLLPASSLVHYLSADVTLEQGVDPRLTLGQRTVRLGRDASFVEAVTDVLRRCFYLDCVARGAGPHGGQLSVTDTFDTLGLDADRLYDAPVAERAITYYDVDFERVAERFPEWHLSMYVEPTFEHVRTVPHFAAALPFVFQPNAEPLSEDEWLSLSLTGGGYESFGLRADGGDVRAGERDASNVDLLNPDLGLGRTHGWLAPGVPVDGFKTYPEAFHNRDTYLDGSGGPLSVTVVVNDTNARQHLFETPDGPGMHDEQDESVSYYRSRADELNIDVEVRENLTTGALARVFESENDLVHFIGHHDEDGLDCLDGSLSADTLAESRAETFFLNACGSFPFGAELIKNGSVAGGATFESVSDSDAFEVGGTFARLIVTGHSVNRALAVASRKTIAPKDYVVIGDGTHRVLQTDSIVPSEMRVTETGHARYEVVKQQPISRRGGMKVNMGFDSDPDEYRLSGTTERYEVRHEALVNQLKKREAPILFNDELYWPQELTEALNPRSPPD